MYLLPDPHGFPHVGFGTGFACWPALVPLKVDGEITRLAPRVVARPTLGRFGWSCHKRRGRR
jgi:hypothetical protein